MRDAPGPCFRWQTAEVVKSTPQESMVDRTVEQIVDVTRP